MTPRIGEISGAKSLRPKRPPNGQNHHIAIITQNRTGLILPVCTCNGDIALSGF
tara:strand:+ start:56760 stop:56921 length:162 start_codon:yes stop_codon:yes gene_type:complete